MAEEGRKVEADRLEQEGIEQYGRGNYREALEIYQKVLAMRREIGDRSGTGATLHRIGAAYNKLGDYARALDFYGQALEIRQEIGDRQGMGSSLNSMGAVYVSQGEYDKALEVLNQALALRQEIDDRAGTARTLNNIGVIYQSQGKYARALDFYQQALEIVGNLGNRRSEGALLNNIGLLQIHLGQYEQALALYQKTLALRRELGDSPAETLPDSPAETLPDSPAETLRDRRGEGETLHNIGLVYKLRSQYRQALDFYQQALAVRSEIGDRAGVGQTLNNMGLVRNELGQHDRALDDLQQALAIAREIGDRRLEGQTLESLGTAYKTLGDYDRARDFYQQALAIQREVGDKSSERIALSHIGDMLVEQNQPELAIVFYKQSVNVTEEIRQDLKALSPEQQQSYLETVADTYRTLADLLLHADRTIEAQQILDLLKIQELDNYLRNVPGNEETARGIELLPQELEILDSFARIENNAIALGKELRELRRLSASERTPAQERRIRELEQREGQLAAEFDRFVRSSELANRLEELRRVTSGESLAIQNFQKLQSRLRQLQQNAAILYPLVLDDRLELVLVTADAAPVRRTVSVDRQQLEEGVSEFRAALTVPRYRMQPNVAREKGLQLYNWLIKPLERDLAEAKIETIVYAPDGMLRYIPLAALYDGDRWLVELFRINNITAASLANFQPQPVGKIRLFAGAFAEGSYQLRVGKIELELSGLPFARSEVEYLAAIIPNTTAVFNLAFNPEATVPSLNEYNIVHLATHAAFLKGYPEDSFILLGDGSRITLRDLENWSVPNVELVVLSACQTGVGGVGGNGREILGFGYQLQQAGAKAAIASLWSVDDLGTRALMAGFYQRFQTGTASKAEALRQAQLALISGEVSEGDRFSSLQHPYYWAPFILIGNGF